MSAWGSWEETEEQMLAQLRARYRWDATGMWIDDRGPTPVGVLAVAQKLAADALQDSIKLRNREEALISKHRA